MSTPSDVIAALLARKRKRLWFRDQDIETPPGEFPPGWRAWFAAMPRRDDAVTGAPADAMLAVLSARTPRPPPPRTGDLGHWQLLLALVRPRWQAAPRGDRRDHRVAIATSAGLHLLLAWLLLVLPHGPLPPAPAERRGDQVVQVEFIGEGTPEDTGGGAPANEADPAQQPADAPRPAQAALLSAAAAAAPVPSSDATPPPEPAPEVAVVQPLQVTQTPVPDSRFVLPPTTPRELRVDAPAPAPTPAVQVRPREIELATTPTAPALRQQVVQPRPPAPAQVVERQLQAREIPTLVRPTAMPQLAQQPAEAARVAAPSQQVRTRDVPLAPSPAGEQRSSQAAEGASERPTAARAGQASAPSASASGQRGDTGTAQRPQAGRGDQATRPGAPPATRRGDDWGDSNRNRAGGQAGQAGLFDGDGRPRLPPGTAAAGGGFPPGSDDWTREQLDRYGTWSTRPPIGYEPTRFDRYWIPTGNLLEEWVRRGVKSVAIPIPGTSKKINCLVSLLQLGGGCGISDDNLRDQEATARPPPDIPYKPELQDGNP